MLGNPRSVMFVFPGQGSQYRGMGSDLHESFAVARSVYQRASDALGYDMAELSFRDPGSRLDLTSQTQPALLTHSIACLEVFRDLTDGEIVPDLAAGHSLGEYTALVAAGTLTFDEALRLVRRRGELMSEHGAGQMLAIPMDVEQLRRYAERHYCGIGGCNLPNQTVIGGLTEDLESLMADLKRDDPRARGTFLKTEGAFHTYLMVNAAIQFRAELEKALFRTPSCEVLSNYTGEFHEPDPEGIRYRLFYQLFHPVKWVWGVQRALERGIGMIVEFGGGLGGDSPATMRPNLASIINRIVKARQSRFGRRREETTALDFEALYAPAINLHSIKQAARLARSIRRIQIDGADPAATHALYVPTSGGIPVSTVAVILQKVEELGLGDRVALVAQDVVANEAFLSGLGGDIKRPAPYLAVATPGADPAYKTGADLDEALRLLADAAPAA